MIKIANAPCSWGVLEFDLEGQAPDYIQVLNEIKETGYVGSELGDWGFMPTDPKELAEELIKRKLTMVGAFVPVFLKDKSAHADGIAVAIKTANLMKNAGYENAFIVLADDNGKVDYRTKNAGRITPDFGLNNDEWKIFSEGSNNLAKAVKDETGLRTVFHHHCAGFVETPSEVDKLMELTDPNLLGLVLDMGHYMFGGGDPLIALKKHENRIWHIHFKDCENNIAEKSRKEKWNYFESVKNGVFCELGKGAVDFPSIVIELKNINYEGWIVVEQDVLPGMGNPKECAQHNRDYIKKLGL
ncbi:MAG: TIM barrel protein [Ignavibacteriae bacterium]|nr:TIM barrel protein [Ignavibacteriota bacterium]